MLLASAGIAKMRWWSKLTEKWAVATHCVCADVLRSFTCHARRLPSHLPVASLGGVRCHCCPPIIEEAEKCRLFAEGVRVGQMGELQSALLLKKQLAELRRVPVDGFSAGLQDDDIYKWEVLVIGPPDTL
ncbi:putative ubiquitin-conjugating enzyme E2 7 [Toxocara canis]|uniref:Putative ubiquitin-conjugating enzyme E2 7 n=1 Tax=Toxocara canis TaxID=6265 RepID=A0A0B2ULS6_TOXCA|nr:putative ubiquitin-conjugating enzyme E2 7 [Toxocara canis]